MSLQTLLLAGAEAISSGVTAQLGWYQDKNQVWKRMPLTQPKRQHIQRRVAERLGRNLSAVEYRELDRIIDASVQATRNAGLMSGNYGRMLAERDLMRVPGTGNLGGSVITYTVAFEIKDRQTGFTRTFTHQVRDRTILGPVEIRERAMRAAQSGEILQRMGSGPPDIRRYIIQELTVVSVYLGIPDLPNA